MLQMLSCRMDIAARYGTDAAIFMNNIVFWTLKNAAENRNFHEGRYWTYGTISGFAKLYPLWSEPQLKRIISKCREEGILLVGDFNEDRRDRTRWYSPSDEILALYSDGVDELCIVRKRKMQSTKSSAPSDEIGKCNKVQVATQEENTPLPPTGELAVWFDRFWAAYPKKMGKQAARRAWDKLAPDLELCRVMAAALARQRRSRDWTRENGRYIPYPASWLNGRRWEDEVEDLPEAPPPKDDERRGQFL